MTTPRRLITRAEIVERAESWLRSPVACSETKFHANEHGIYRADCSGFVSMAWGLPGKPPDRNGGLRVDELLEVTVEITKDELRVGDVLLADGHLVIFAGWACDDAQKYWGYEQADGSRTALRLVEYPYESGEFVPRRYLNVVDS